MFPRGEKYVCGLNSDAVQFIKENLNETENVRIISLNLIKEWLLENSYLHGRADDIYILPFLRVCKFNIEETKQKIIKYYTMKRDRPEWFTNRDPFLKEIQELVKLGVFVPLKLMNNNKLVVIIRPGAHDPKIYAIDNVFKTGKMILDIASLKNENAQVYGITAIFDMTGVGVAHARQMTPGVIKKAVYAWQNYHCLPKELEFINAPFYINFVLNIFKSNMSEHLQGQVHVHFEGLGTLPDTMDTGILPPEYGGNGDTMDVLTNYWMEQLVFYRDWFVQDEQFKCD